MILSASLSLLRDGHEHVEKLAAFDYIPSADGSGSYGLEQELSMQGNKAIKIGSSCTANGNLSFAVWHGGKHYLTGMFIWDTVTPYLGVRLPDLGFLHIYFKKTAT
jgi:hypothetical protein